ncbi:MAG: ABC transporter permease, partial [Alphaproteobacteria bacterium]|nr:ABC transporter permease [Alphaproteobacteria bacterium]
MLSKQIENFLRALGKPLVAFLMSLGKLSVFIVRAVYHALTPPIYFKNFIKQVLEMGFYSVPVVGLTTIFAGMVIALQTYSGFSKY